MNPDRRESMYLWRKFSPAARNELLAWRKSERRPWHSPPHYVSDDGLYLITAACYEHQHVIGYSPERMRLFSGELLTAIETAHLHAWVLLPNHYHLLLQTQDLKDLLYSLSQLHGRTSFHWNGEEDQRGRKVWCIAAETAIQSEGHFYTVLQYVLHNPVRHGYTRQWQDWLFSNAVEYLSAIGRAEAEKRWRLYPLLDFGKTWDPPEL
jgi:putative transposase